MNMKTLPSFIKQYFTNEELVKLQKKDAFHADEFKELFLIRLIHDYKDYLRGTVFYEGGFIPGYPRIMRVLHLENGINHYLKNSFYVEEKVDGYNVRIGVINGIPLAFTRGGFNCPFSTDRITDFIDINFFNEYPHHIICGE